MYQNDKFESVDYYSTLLEIVKEIAVKNKEIELAMYYYEVLEKLVEGRFINKEKKSYADIDIPDYAYNDAGYFVFSTCLEKNYIPMWNYYSENSGVCVEFDEKELYNFFKKATDCCKEDKMLFELYNCIYDEKEKKKLLETCINIVKNEMIRYSVKKEEKSMYIYVAKFLGSMLKYAYMFKDKGFKYENERRFVFKMDSNLVYEDYCDIKEDKDKPDSEKNTRFPNNIKKDFLCINNTIKPILKIGSKDRIPISDVIISPLNTSETTVRGVKRLLDYYGHINIKPKRANSGIRNS